MEVGIPSDHNKWVYGVGTESQPTTSSALEFGRLVLSVSGNWESEATAEPNF